MSTTKLDVNAVVGGLLRDLAETYGEDPRRFAYKRAAAVVMSLESSVADLVRPDHTLEKIPGIGPASARVIFEVLETGASPTVETVVERSGKTTDIERRRALRRHFFSRAEALRILRDPLLGGPRREQYRGDLQMHSEWSDGSSTLTEIADACLARGYSHSAVTDHSHGLRIAGGMSMAEAADQRRAIDGLNNLYAGRFRLIRGIEANIGSDGQLDLTADEAAQFELVLAAPHAKLRSADDQTARLLRSVENPHVHVLAHPRGRIAGSRAGIAADWTAVFAAARALGVAIEIDGDPARQDLDHTLAASALDAGCLFALDSDAHTPSQLRYVDLALAHARVAGIPHDRIVNCWPLERLLDWLNSRSAHPAAFAAGASRTAR